MCLLVIFIIYLEKWLVLKINMETNVLESVELRSKYCLLPVSSPLRETF